MSSAINIWMFKNQGYLEENMDLSDIFLGYTRFLFSQGYLAEFFFLECSS